MHILESYCRDNSLLVNIEKTKIVKFSNGGPLAAGDKLVYQGKPIEFVKNFCYLGVILSTKLSVNQHLQCRKTKALNAINCLHSKLDLSKINVDSANRLLTSVVMPSATYGCEIFDDGGPDFDTSFTKHQLTIIGYFWKKMVQDQLSI